MCDTYIAVISLVERLHRHFLEAMTGDPPLGFPNAFTMRWDELLDFLADRAVGFEPCIEVVYPGAHDPTA